MLDAPLKRVWAPPAPVEDAGLGACQPLTPHDTLMHRPAAVRRPTR